MNARVCDRCGRSYTKNEGLWKKDGETFLYCMGIDINNASSKEITLQPYNFLDMIYVSTVSAI